MTNQIKKEDVSLHDLLEIIIKLREDLEEVKADYEELSKKVEALKTEPIEETVFVEGAGDYYSDFLKGEIYGKK